jgi:hypothetical protein
MIAEGMRMREYAKLARVKVQPEGRGFQARLRLPSELKFTSNTGNFINFYCGMGQYECGISTAVGRPGWRWFANCLDRPANGGGTFGEFQNGDYVTVKLSLNDRIGQVEFWVNGTCCHLFPQKWPDETGFADCRFIFGALTSPYVGGTLPPWGSWHGLTLASSMMYKDRSKVWREINKTNATADVFHWPSGVPCPDPQNYRLDSSMLDCSAVTAELAMNSLSEKNAK